MKMKRAVALLLVFAMLLTLSGCGMKSQQQRAIEDAVTSYSKYYIEVPRLSSQIRKQARTLTGYEDSAEYTLDVQFPDYSTIDIRQIDYTVPTVDYDNPSGEAYIESFREAIGLGLQQYAMNTKVDGAKSAELVFQLRLTDGKWTATPTRASLSAMEKQISGMLDEKAAEITTLPKEYTYACIAEQKDALFGSLIGESAYLDAVRITGIEDSGTDQYRISFQYPDPAAAFAALGEAYTESYSQLVFGAVTCTLDPDEYPSVASGIAMKSGSITVSGSNDTYSVTDGAVFADEYAAARDNAQQAAADAVAEKWGVAEVSKPAVSRIMLGTASGSSGFELSLYNSVPDTYISIYKIDSSTSEEGTFVLSFFIKSGDDFYVDLPVGKYKVVGAYGDTWYGTDYLFGPDGHYFYINSTMETPTGNRYRIWTVYLHWSDVNGVISTDYDVDISSK